jgi:hypothetical protein
VDFLCPRTLATTFEPRFIELVHDLRHHIHPGTDS